MLNDQAAGLRTMHSSQSPARASDAQPVRVIAVASGKGGWVKPMCLSILAFR